MRCVCFLHQLSPDTAPQLSYVLEEMRLNVFLLLICCVCLRRVDLSLPDFIPVTPPLQVKASVTRTDFTRLPGLCQRLKRRRVTILCRLEKFCWRVRGQGRSQGRGQKNQSGQVCRCPRGSRCSHFFVHSL